MEKNVNVEQWVGLFREVGLDNETMMKWHKLFEARYPEGHQSFLEWLGLPAEEIRKIRLGNR